MIDVRSGTSREYLGELKRALSRIDADLAVEIYEGIAEELGQLDDEQARMRISELGPAKTIAGQASESSPSGVLQSRGFGRAASLVLAFAWLVAPVIGYVIGAVAVLLSPRWTTPRKIGAIVAPLLIGGIVAAGVGVVMALSGISQTNAGLWNVIAGGYLAFGIAAAVFGLRLCALLRKSEDAQPVSMVPGA